MYTSPTTDEATETTHSFDTTMATATENTPYKSMTAATERNDNNAF